MKKEINIAGARARPFMENARCHGWSVSAIDGFHDWDGEKYGRFLGEKKHGELDSLSGKELKYLARGNPVLFCSPIENSIRIIREAEKCGLKVLNSSSESIEECRKISSLKKICGGEVLFPDTDFDRRGRWINKKKDSAGGLGIRDYEADVGPEEYSQRFISGISVGTAFITSKIGETALIGVSRHIMNNSSFRQREFQYGGLIYPFSIPDRQLKIFEEFGQKAGDFLGLSGFWGADFILCGERLYLLEINPRFSATLELIGIEHRLDLISAQTDALEGTKLPTLKTPAKTRATAVCYAERSFAFSDPEPWFNKGARDIPHKGERIVNGRPILSIYAEARSENEALEKLEELATCFYGKNQRPDGEK